jgi:hypothetical protein
MIFALTPAEEISSLVTHAYVWLVFGDEHFHCFSLTSSTPQKLGGFHVGFRCRELSPLNGLSDGVSQPPGRT